MNIIIEPVYSVSGINSSRHTEFAPFAQKDENTVVIDTEFWTSLHSSQRRSILGSFGTAYRYSIEDNLDPKLPKEGKVFERFHSAYNHSYNINNWYQLLDRDFHLSVIDSGVYTHLKELANQAILKQRKITSEDLSFYPEKILNPIKAFLSRHRETGVFMKLSDKSSKNSSVLSPKFTIEEIVEEIVNNRELISALERNKHDACLFLSPWSYDIDKNNEYRVIVVDGSVTGISQQQCYRYVGITQEKVKRDAVAILSYFSRIAKDLPYVSCVLDVWIGSSGAVSLIEINPGEMWASSGSGLFNWKSDKDKLYQKGRTFVRYVETRDLSVSRTSSRGSEASLT